MKTNNTHFMQAALAQAQLAYQQDEVPVGAVVVFNNEIIASAHNQSIIKNDVCAHAEILALRSACEVLKNYRLPECDLYVTLEPCCMCFGAMIHARIRNLFYSCVDNKSGALDGKLQLHQGNLFNHSIEINQGLLVTESKNLLQQFFRERR